MTITDPFTLTVSLGSAKYDISPPVTDHSNFRIQYQYSATNISTFQEFISTGDSNATQFSNAEGAKSLYKNSQVTILTTISSGPEDLKCEATKFICFVIMSTNGSSYNDSSLDNNVFCFDAILTIECFPCEYFLSNYS